MLSFNQKTIKENVYFEGVGLHTGKKVNIELVPAESNHGIVFERTDLNNQNLINADFNNVKHALLCTTFRVGTYAAFAASACHAPMQSVFRHLSPLYSCMWTIRV